LNSSLNAGNNIINNLNVGNAFDDSTNNNNNKSANSLNFGVDLNNNEKSKRRGGSGNNVGQLSPSLPSQSNNNTNHLNFDALSGDRVNRVSNSNNNYGAFGGNSLFDSGVGSVSTASNSFSRGFDSQLGNGTSYLSSNNSAFSMDLPNVNTLGIEAGRNGSNRLAVDDDDDEEILLMASNPSFGSSGFGSFGSGFGSDSTLGVNSGNHSLSGDVRKHDKKKNAPPGFGNVNDDMKKW